MDIRYRVWWGGKVNEMIYPNDPEILLTQDGSVCIHDQWGEPQVERYPDMIPMLSTGFHDKNGKEIWEGDILEFDAEEWGEDKNNRWVVTWDASTGAWCTGGGIPGNRECSEWKTVIGNVHEMPTDSQEWPT